MAVQRISNIPENDDELLVDALRSAFERSGTDPSSMFDSLAVAIEHEIWAKRGLTFVQLLQAPYPKGIGITPAKLETLLKLEHRYEANHAETRERMAWLRRQVADLLNPALAPKGTNQYVRSDGGDNNVMSTERQGNDPEYAIRRLKRDRPDLAEQVLAGEISPHRAAIAAGFRKKTITVAIDDPERIAATLRRHLTPEQVAALKEAL